MAFCCALLIRYNAKRKQETYLFECFQNCLHKTFSCYNHEKFVFDSICGAPGTKIANNQTTVGLGYSTIYYYFLYFYLINNLFYLHYNTKNCEQFELTFKFNYQMKPQLSGYVHKQTVVDFVANYFVIFLEVLFSLF